MVYFGHFLLIEGNQFWFVEANCELILFQMDFEFNRHDFFDPTKLLIEWDYSSGKTIFKKGASRQMKVISMTRPWNFLIVSTPTH